MTQVNLLPWRELQREEGKKQFISLLVASLVAVLFIMIGAHFVMSSKIDHQISRNSFLKGEIKKLDRENIEIKEIKRQRAALIARMQIIQNLQTNRTQVVHIFEELINILPKGVHLVNVSSNGNVVTIQGRAESNTNVSKLMRSVGLSKWLEKPVLSEIKTDKVSNRHVSDFRLQFMQGNRNLIKGGN